MHEWPIVIVGSIMHKDRTRGFAGVTDKGVPGSKNNTNTTK